MMDGAVVGGQWRPGPVVTQNGRYDRPRGRGAFLNYQRDMANRGPVPDGKTNSTGSPPLAGTSFYALRESTPATAVPGIIPVTGADPRTAAGPGQLADLAHPVNPDPAMNALMPSLSAPSPKSAAGDRQIGDQLRAGLTAPPGGALRPADWAASMGIAPPSDGRAVIAATMTGRAAGSGSCSSGLAGQWGGHP